MPGQLRNFAALDSIIQSVGHISGLEKTYLHRGDFLFVRTRNSTYRIYALGNNTYEVAGGWFDKKGLSPMKTTIAGCTWGGSAIMTGFAAACGLCLEFGNRLVTTPVSRIHLVRREQQN
ncbi:MAG: hypothetical protein WEB33_07315 [Bacteroidota bacterium]